MFVIISEAVRIAWIMIRRMSYILEHGIRETLSDLAENAIDAAADVLLIPGQLDYGHTKSLVTISPMLLGTALTRA